MGRPAPDPVRGGAGTENTMYRLGDDLLVRLPRTVGRSAALRTELRWLPRLGPRLSLQVPQPVYEGEPTVAYPAAWAVFRWIQGAEVGPDAVSDWVALGSDLAGFVRELHGLDPSGAGELSWYRGGHLEPCDGWVTAALGDCRELIDGADELEAIWRAGLGDLSGVRRRVPCPRSPASYLES